jgi:hypothetical protein
LLFFFGLWVMRVVVLLPYERQLQQPIVVLLLGAVVRIFIWLFPVWCYVYWYEGQSFARYIRPLAPVHPQQRRWAACLVLTYFGCSVIVSHVLQAKPFTTIWLSPTRGLDLLFLPVAPIVEEIFSWLHSASAQYVLALLAG